MEGNGGHVGQSWGRVRALRARDAVSSGCLDRPWLKPTMGGAMVELT